MADALETLAYYKDIIQDHIEYLLDVELFIERYELSTLAAATDKQPLARHNEKRFSYSKTLSTYTSTQTRCCVNVRAKLNTLNIQSLLRNTYRRTYSQGQAVALLTILAFSFVPLLFITSFFGMNFIELGQGTLRIWVIFFVGLPILAFLFLICFWDDVRSYLPSKK